MREGEDILLSNQMQCVEHMQKWGVDITLMDQYSVAQTIWQIVLPKTNKIGTIALYMVA